MLLTSESSIVAACMSKDRVVRPLSALTREASYCISLFSRPGIQNDSVVMAAADEAKSAKDKSLDIVLLVLRRVKVLCNDILSLSLGNVVRNDRQ